MKASPCTCKRPLKMGASVRCGYCGGLIRSPWPAVGANSIPQLGAGAADVYDATKHPDIDELPAQTTNMSAKQFEEWVSSPGKIFIIYLPGQRSFVMKVTDEHHDFFVAMVKQLRMALGPEVQAAAAVACEAPPPPAAPANPVLAADAPRFGTCRGSGLAPAPFTTQIIPKVGKRGTCVQCGFDYQVTDAGNIRLHHAHGPDDE